MYKLVAAAQRLNVAIVALKLGTRVMSAGVLKK
jgi:hypothetical protein